MKNLLFISLVFVFQLSYTGNEREIQNHNKACIVGFVLGSAGTAIVMNALQELEKHPQDSFQQNVYGFGSVVTVIGFGIIGYSLGSQSGQVLRRK